MMKNNKLNTIVIRLLCMVLIIASSCKKFLLVDPPIDQLSPELVFENNDAAIAAITGIYGRMIAGGAAGFASGDVGSVTVIAGLSADEYINYNPSYNEVSMNMLVPNSSTTTSIWSGAYQYIYTSNAIIEGLAKSPNVGEIQKAQLTAEARFIRAFCYFYLVNLFGDVPLHLTTDYRANALAMRKPTGVIYDQIITDLTAAKSALTDVFTADRIRPSKWAATALLARTYLYTRQWELAEIESSELISRQDLFKLETDFSKTFIKESKEVIWQLMPVKQGFNTNEGNLFILTGAPTAISLSIDLVNSFEPGDKRKDNWVGTLTANGNTYYYPFKYKVRTATPITEYSVIFRIAELYLIRAEARIMLNKPSGIEDLNLIRKRARPLPSPSNPSPIPDFALLTTKDILLSAIEHERRVEFFAEWGHRWLDLKRNVHADDVLKSIKGTSWQSTDQLYPIPHDERKANPTITQNNGY